MAKARRHLQQPEWGRILAAHMASSKDLRTQTALARKSGVAQSTIGRILRGEVNPQTGTMTFLSEALRIPLNTLVAGEKPAERREVVNAVFQLLECREDRKRAERTLENLRRKEANAIEHLQELVRFQRKQGPTMTPS